MSDERDLEEIKNFIQQNGEKPKEYTDGCWGNYIGDLGEQFTKALFKGFKGLDIKKLGKEKDDSSPDFAIIWNKKTFNLETKVIRKIYKDYLSVFCDICEEIGKKSLISKYGISVDPFNIHEEDEKIFKEELKKKLNIIIQNDLEYKEFSIHGKIRNYTVTFEKRNIDPTKLCAGEFHKPASNLVNILNKKRVKKQIKKSDILLLIILNDLIEKDYELIDELYKPIGLMTDFDIKSENKSIIQYRFKETVWFDTQLKCVIAIYPRNKNVVICPSLCYYEEFDGGEYTILRKVIEKKGFKVEFIVNSSCIEGV